MIPELCDLLTTSASGKGFVKLRDAILLVMQALCFLADGRQVASLYGGQLISEAQLSMLRESLSKAIVMVSEKASLCLSFLSQTLLTSAYFSLPAAQAVHRDVREKEYHCT